MAEVSKSIYRYACNNMTFWGSIYVGTDRHLVTCVHYNKVKGCLMPWLSGLSFSLLEYGTILSSKFVEVNCFWCLKTYSDQLHVSMSSTSCGRPQLCTHKLVIWFFKYRWRNRYQKAPTGDWTQDRWFTRPALYHWAIEAWYVVSQSKIIRSLNSLSYCCYSVCLVVINHPP